MFTFPYKCYVLDFNTTALKLECLIVHTNQTICCLRRAREICSYKVVNIANEGLQNLGLYLSVRRDLYCAISAVTQDLDFYLTLTG